MVYKFQAEIKLLEGKMKWNVLYFPYSVNEVFGTNGRVTVFITVDGHNFDHTLLPSRNGHYLVYNKIISQVVGKKRGETVEITVKKMMGKRKVEIPNYIEDKLRAANSLQVFMGQPDYIKREQITHVSPAKKEETKLSRISKLVDLLGGK